MTATGTQATGGNSREPAISADGRFVAFRSRATNLVAGDSNGLEDIFVRDRTSGTTTRVSVPDSGFQATGGDSASPAISADGRFVAFESTATNLVAGDNNGVRDIFVRDRTGGTTTRVSVPNSGFQATGGDSRDPAFSADGRFVAFRSEATNLVAGDSNGFTDIFVRDRTSATTTRVSLPNSGAQALGHSVDPSISDDGRFVAFLSNATNLVANDSNARRDLFVRDRTGATTTRLSVTETGTQATGGAGNSFGTSISADGQLVVYETDATNLVANDSNAFRDVFLRDRTGATTTRVSVPNSGFQATGGDSFVAAISDDGRIVAFVSQATNLVAGDSNAFSDVFVRDRTGATTTRVSVTNTGTQATSASFQPAISADGRFVAFESSATNLVAGDSNGFRDIFVRDRGAFVARTRVTLSLARRRIPSGAPLTVRVRNANGFAVFVRLSGETTRPVSRGTAKSLVKLRRKSFNVGGRASKIVKLRLPTVLERLLARNRKLSLRLTAKVTGPAGKTRTVTKKVTPRAALPR